MSSAEVSTNANKPASGGVLPIHLPDKQILYKSYMGFLAGGGLFVPTNKQYSLGDEVFLLVKLMNDTKKYPIAGKVAWITPPCAQGGRVSGIGVQFTSKEAVEVRNKIETYLAGALKSDRHTDTM